MIELRNVTISRGTNMLCNNLSVTCGEKTRIFGPNGSGKTTLLKLIMGLVPPESGAVLYNGEDITSLPPSERPFTFVFQDFGLWEHLKVWENLYWVNNDSNLHEHYLSYFKLTEHTNTRVAYLSAGQKQKLAIIRAFLKPHWETLLLDEPTASLDIESTKAFRQLIANTSYILVSQQLQQLKESCNTIFLLENGNLSPYK